MKIILYFLIPLFIISCTPSNNKKSDINSITKNGELLVSVFKKDFKNNRGSYHIWTKHEKKNKTQIDSIRKELGLSFDYTIYLYSDSALDEGHYYAYCLDYFKMNPIQKFNNKSSNGIYIEDKKPSPNERVESTIKDLNEGIKINSIAGIILFQGQIKKGEKLLSECDDKSMCDKLRRALSAFQRKHFPLARKMYYNNAKEKLWEKNIEVKLNGRDITFEGYMFADNCTIKATYEEIRKELEDLRFQTVGFRWYEGGDRTYWKLNVKNDGEI